MQQYHIIIIIIITIIIIIIALIDHLLLLKISGLGSYKLNRSFQNILLSNITLQFLKKKNDIYNIYNFKETYIRHITSKKYFQKLKQRLKVMTCKALVAIFTD